jgi:trimeric autotransporter adhesin
MVSGTLDASGRNAGEHGGKVTVAGDNVALLNGTFIGASGYEGKSGTTSGKDKFAVREGSGAASFASAGII